MRFGDIIGLDGVKRLLARSADEGRVSHAQLFSGECGCGALPLAIAYAGYLNCSAPAGGDSCGECPSCIKMDQLAHPDVHYVFPVKASEGSVRFTSDDFLPQWRRIVRKSGGYFDETQWYEALDMGNKQGIISKAEADSIIRKLSFKSYEGGYKVMIVWQPERMRTEAANALLKILEEPWERTLFILVSPAPSRLLTTITSRCQELSLPLPEPSEAAAYMVSRFGTERERAAVVARLSRGNVIEAGRMTEEEEEDGGHYFELFVQLMRLSYGDRHLELLEWAESAAALGREEQKRLLTNALRLLRESYIINAGVGSAVYLWGSELDFCRKFSPFIGNHNIEALKEGIESALAQLGQNGNSKIIFTHFALEVSKLIVRRQ